MGPKKDKNKSKKPKVGLTDKEKKKPKVGLTDKEKKKLAFQVQQRPALWNISDPSYMKRDVVAVCWKIVSENTEISVPACKAAWKSMKDALNYRKKEKPGKSGDGLEDSEKVEDDDDYSNTDNNLSLTTWTLWESLKFLNDSKPLRKTISTMLSDEESQEKSAASIYEKQGDQDEMASPDDGNVEIDVIEVTDAWISESSLQTTDDTLPAGLVPVSLNLENSPIMENQPKKLKRPAANYEYMSGKRKKEVPIDEDTKKIASGIIDLVNLRKQSLATQPQSPQTTLQYFSIYANLDRMLVKLPANVVEDLNMQFISLAYAQVKKI